MSNLDRFKALHKKDDVLLLGNIWDAHTASLAEKADYEALGSSSHAIAFSLGYADGEQISFEELLFVLKRIAVKVTIPLSVDFEAGYSSDPDKVADYVKQLTDIGVVGINLEDGQVKDGKRILGEASLLADKIKAIKANTDIFINARADTYTTKAENALKESIRRAGIYKAAGADGVFIPLIEKPEEIKQFVSEVDLPLNVFATASLPGLQELASLGVKRVSHGAKQYDALLKKAAENFERFKATGDYNIILA
ncbi:MAG: isocitrate lyase/phosphoenolpyruvate mutase family protein [Chitinophagaceae bacterium]|nr:isocitrate lyase/phosphoenolpyruvate mutase family protein [Chitinophagaceae bacterium]MCW5928492.1 isocitrate lyase/phosphoenolpyruvate mutase family protein [Chitinophagaceae bacterium]